MTANKLPYAVAAALVASLALAGCNKDEPATDTSMAPPPMASEPAPLPPAEPMPTEAALDVTSVTLGSEAGADKSIASPMTTFGASDPIIVSIATNGAASNAVINAKLVYEDGQTAGDESQSVTTTGMETTNITFNNANGWPAGTYTAEVWVDGAKLNSTPFSVE
ncbi:hypothetical protein [Lysobacter sp. A289]